MSSIQQKHFAVVEHLSIEHTHIYYIDVNELDVCYIILSSLSPSHRLSVVQLRQITVPKWVEQSSRAAKYVLYLVAMQCLLVWICYKVKFNIFTRAFAYVAVSFSLYEWIYVHFFFVFLLLLFIFMSLFVDHHVSLLPTRWNTITEHMCAEEFAFYSFESYSSVLCIFLPCRSKLQKWYMKLDFYRNEWKKKSPFRWIRAKRSFVLFEEHNWIVEMFQHEIRSSHTQPIKISILLQ